MANETVYIEKELCTHVRIANDSGADLVQYEFAVVGPYAAVADDIIVADAVGSIHVEEGIQVQTTDLHATQNTFATIGQKVYWDTASGTFSDTSTAAYYLVGHLITVKDTNDMILFEKERYAVVVPASLVDITALVALNTTASQTTNPAALAVLNNNVSTEGSVLQVVSDNAENAVFTPDGTIAAETIKAAIAEVSGDVTTNGTAITAVTLNAVHVVDAVITANASAGIAFDPVADLGMVDGDIITDVMVIATATEASCVLTLSHDGGNAITDGISCVTANAIVRAGSLDQAEVSVAAATDLKVTASAGTAANARGIVRISYRRA